MCSVLSHCARLFYCLQGWVIVPEFFKKEELDACRRDVEELVDNVANLLFENGKIKGKATEFCLNVQKKRVYIFSLFYIYIDSSHFKLLSVDKKFIT